MSIRPTVVVIGAGPAALAAARRLRAEPRVRVVLVAPGGMADYLPGALMVATGDARIDDYRSRLRLDGVEVIGGTAEAIGPGRVRVDGSDLQAQVVIATPGLALDPLGGAVGTSGTGPDGARSGRRMVSFWDLTGAARVAPVVQGFEHGTLTVVIASPLYRCPPAPYGLAIRLARRAELLGLDVRVRLTTPEPRPLAAIGSAVGEFLLASCARAGVDVRFEVHPDPAALVSGQVTDSAGTALETDLAVVIPPHRAHPLLTDLAGAGQLVTVDDWGRTAQGGIYVAGDAADSPYPRATAPAALSGIAAAEGALADLALAPATRAGTPDPDCFVDQGAGRYGRIQISYPAGPPPLGRPPVVIDESAPADSGGFEAALDRWRDSCTDRPAV